MKTKTINKKAAGKSPAPNIKPAGQNDVIIKDAEYKQVSTADIDFSPLNYRKYFSEDALQQFAEELKQHGIISPLTLRPHPAGRYELVAGERRLRAARIAGLSAIPAAIVSLTDEQVIEIQLSENLQRENPPPDARGPGHWTDAAIRQNH